MHVMLINLEVKVPRDNFYHNFLFITEHVNENEAQIKERMKQAENEYEGGDYFDAEKYRRMNYYGQKLWNKYGLHRIDNHFDKEGHFLEVPYTIVKLLKVNI